MKKNHRSILFTLTLAASSLAPVFAQQNQSVAVPTIEVSAYRVRGDARLSDAEAAALLAPFAGGRRTMAQIDDAAHALEKNLHDRGFVFLRVVVPAQRPVDGVITLEIIRFNLGHVNVSGNEHFTTPNIRRSLPSLVESEAPELNSIGRDLAAANANPSKQVAITFREGQQPETIDADVTVKDVDPTSFFVDYTSNRSLNPLHGATDNTYRATIGYQNANLFDLDHVVTLSYTTDPFSPNQVGLYGAFYQIPIYGTRANVAAYYTHSDVNSGQVQQGAGFFDVSGKGDFFGVRLTEAFARVGTLQQTGSISLDEHDYSNTTTFEGTQIQPDVGALPITLEYALRLEKPWGNVDASLSYVVNTGGGADNAAADYAANGSVRNWSAWRYSADALYKLEGWDLAGRFKGQWSLDPLIAGEQFGLGGMNSVRGFADREISGDFGYSYSLEAKAPAMLIPDFRPLVFVDGGEAHSRLGVPKQNLLSTGVGFRYTHEKIDVTFDLAHALQRNTSNPIAIHDRMDLMVSYHF